MQDDVGEKEVYVEFQFCWFSIIPPFYHSHISSFSHSIILAFCHSHIPSLFSLEFILSKN